MGALKTALVLLIGTVIAACADYQVPAEPSPTNAYVEWAGGGGTLYFEVTSKAALADFLNTPKESPVQLDALPGGAEIACHKKAKDGSAVTIWDDGSPDSKTLGQEVCNR